MPIVLTFDNLGEASELERGTWDGSVPLGQHPSVAIALPHLLDELDELGLRATFFVEGINCELNPGAVTEIAARGHELGVHGWRHEPWAPLSADRERELLDRSTTAFEQLGLRPTGFRPPGGGLTHASPELLAQRGYGWCSPTRDAVPHADPGDRQADPACATSLRWVPFDWELVDAYHLMERFADMREAQGDDPRPLTPAGTEQRLAAGLQAGGPSTVLILHPFLMLDPDWWQASRRLLRAIAESQ